MPQCLSIRLVSSPPFPSLTSSHLAQHLSGWLEDEVKGLYEAAKAIPLSTYLRILTAPLTADFTEATLLLDAFYQSLSNAWRERERTQFIQVRPACLLCACWMDACPTSQHAP